MAIARLGRFSHVLFSHVLFLVDVSDIFNFFCSGRRKGESEASGGGGSIFIENPRRGGGIFSREGGRGRGAGRVSAANWGIWGGG